jgi:hypothetical protein
MMTQALNALNISSSPGEESLAEKASARKQAGRQNNGIGHVGLRATNPAASLVLPVLHRRELAVARNYR